MKAHRNDVNPLSGQFLGRLLGDITSDTADGPLGLELGVVEEGLDDGSALVASGAKYSDELLVGHFSSGVVGFSLKRGLMGACLR